MLPDTYGTDSFLKEFTLEKAKLWDGVRWDSGDWKVFTNKIINHYKKLDIDPTTKTIIFSDSLNTKLTIEIKKYCDGKIKCSFGIGTFFTSDFKKISNKTKSKAMNMVIKLTKINDVSVVKLSDTPAKSIGDKKMVEIMKYIHFNN
jgi:nicotinate phosphoribosyltransferase